MDRKKSVKLTLYVTYFFMFALLALAIALPWLITLYSEIMHRQQALAATVMITCYPCMPLAAVALWSIRKILLNVLDDKILIVENVRLFRRIAWCCASAGLIMLIAGIFYMPFYIAGIAAVACALVTMVVKNFLHTAVDNKSEGEINK